MHTSQQPGDSRGGPGYGQLRDFTFLDHLHHSEDRRRTQDDWTVFQPRVIHYDSYLVFIVPLNAGYLDLHHNKSFWIHHDAAYAQNWRNFPSHLLSEAVQRQDIHSLLAGIGRDNEIKLRPIV